MWFHIRLLERCNLHCSHCYAKVRERGAILSVSRFKRVLEQVQQIDGDSHQRTVLYLSGGEPLMHPEFEELLTMAAQKDYIDGINILTNGILVPNFLELIQKFSHKVGVQISLDGDRATNDSIRGNGSFDAALEALSLLNEANIIHWISYTVSRKNCHTFKSIMDVCKKYNCINNNVTPYSGDKQNMLTYLEWKEFKYVLAKYAKQIGLEKPHGPNCCGFKYGCGAYITGLTVNPDGTATGCARFNQSEGTFDQLEVLKSHKPQKIYKTCMRYSWDIYPDFSLLAILE